MSNTEEKSVHEQIMATPDGMASIKQINWVVSLYKDLIKKSIIMRLFSKLKFIKLKPEPSEY